MIRINPIEIDDKTALGVKVDLPDSPPLLLVIGERGFVMCGFLNMDAAEKLSVAAAMVSGVKTFEDVLEAEVRGVTSRAKKKGIKLGMTGEEALKLL
ncbi:MAG: YunC family protein [Candidatus Bathyarchaeia archaeon]